LAQQQRARSRLGHLVLADLELLADHHHGTAGLDGRSRAPAPRPLRLHRSTPKELVESSRGLSPSASARGIMLPGKGGPAVAVSTREPRMDIRLSDEQRRDFEEKGYVVLPDFFEPDELRRLYAAIDEVRDEYDR